MPGCSESHVVVLDFDHVAEDKVTEIARLVGNGAKADTIDGEIAKCDIACANCHRRRTAARSDSWRERAYRGAEFAAKLEARVRRNLILVRDLLETQGCADCGEADIRTLEFDHTGAKRFSVMTAVLQGYSIEVLSDEIQRCRLRCANCHRLRTAEQGGHFRYWALLASDAAAEIPPGGVEPTDAQGKSLPL